MYIIENKFSIGDKGINIEDKIQGLVINDNITWPGCKFGHMNPTECDWDFSDMLLERFIRLAWNQFKVEIRSKFFKKLGNIDLIQEATGRDKTLKVIEILDYVTKRNTRMIKIIIKSVNLMIEMGMKKEAIISGLIRKFDIEYSEAYSIYESAKRE